MFDCVQNRVMLGLFEMMWRPDEDLNRARPSTPRLHDSVAPLVKMISPGFACRNAASLSRASSIAARASRPAAWTLDGLPKWRLRYGSIASRAASHTVWWRCNQDRSSIHPLALTRA